jgi:hypothetical protein
MNNKITGSNILANCGQYYKFFTAVITTLAAYFSMILTDLCRLQRNYDRKKFYNIGHRHYHYVLAK